MAFAVCVLLFYAVSPLMCPLSQQMVLFSFWEASAVANRILVVAGEYVDIFLVFIQHFAIRNPESTPLNTTVYPLSNLNNFIIIRWLLLFLQKPIGFPIHQIGDTGFLLLALVPYISYLDCSFVVGSYSYRLH